MSMTPRRGVWRHGAPTSLDPELTGMPGVYQAAPTLGFLGVGWVLRRFGDSPVQEPVLASACPPLCASACGEWGQDVPASGYKKPKVLGGVGSCAPILSGPPGYPSGLFIEHCRNLSPRTVVGCPCSLRPAANWARCERPCPGSGSLGPLVAMPARAGHDEFMLS